MRQPLLVLRDSLCSRPEPLDASGTDSRGSQPSRLRRLQGTRHLRYQSRPMGKGPGSRCSGSGLRKDPDADHCDTQAGDVEANPNCSRASEKISLSQELDGTPKTEDRRPDFVSLIRAILDSTSI